MVFALIDQDTKRWKAELVKRTFLPFEADTILSIPLSYSLPDNKLIWMGNKRGEFSVRSAYYVALPIVETNHESESSTGDLRTPLWKKVWHLNLPAKTRIFSWQAWMNALSTMQNLRARGVNTDGKCLICDQCNENTLHALFACDIPKLVWSYWLGRLAILKDRLVDIIDVAFQVISNGISLDLETLFVINWYILFNRNQVVYESTSHPPVKYGTLTWGLLRTTKVLCHLQFSSEVIESLIVFSPNLVSIK